MRSAMSVVVAAVMLLFAWMGTTQAAEQKPALWLYCPSNLLVDTNIDKLETLWTRGRQSRVHARDAGGFKVCPAG